MRICTCCEAAKPLDDFYRNAKRGTYEARCKDCFKRRVNEYAEANRERVREGNRVAGEKFRSANREFERQRLREHARANKGKYAANGREWRQANPGLNAAKEARRRAAKAKATPVWADTAAIKLIYEEAARLSKETGVQMHVDHIIPLKSDVVCGLHCEANLRVVPAVVNLSKSNRLVDALV